MRCRPCQNLLLEWLQDDCSRWTVRLDVAVCVEFEWMELGAFAGGHCVDDDIHPGVRYLCVLGGHHDGTVVEFPFIEAVVDAFVVVLRVVLPGFCSGYS